MSGMSGISGWIGFDLDGTLAEYHGWQGPEHIGAPVPAMVELVKKYIAEGSEVRIFTARVWRPTFEAVADVAELERRTREAEQARTAIESWCAKNIGVVLPITNIKDYGMILLYDDRCKQVVFNQGIVVVATTEEVVSK